MPDPIEVAIKSALITKLLALPRPATVPISVPNVGNDGTRVFNAPDPAAGAAWFRATLIPAPTIALHLEYTGANQHYGMMQVDAFGYMGDGEMRVGRNASAIISWFKRGTRMSKDGFRIEVTRAPYEHAMLTDGSWVYIPVDVPYIAYASSFPDIEGAAVLAGRGSVVTAMTQIMVVSASFSGGGG